MTTKTPCRMWGCEKEATQGTFLCGRHRRQAQAALFPELVEALRHLLKDAEAVEAQGYGSQEEADYAYSPPESFRKAQSILAQAQALMTKEAPDA